MKENIPFAEIMAAKNGSEAALAAIIARYMPLIRRLAKRAAQPGLDFEDATQEGLIGLFTAIEHYRPDCGAAFSTYAAVCVRNAIISAGKAAGRKKHQPLNQSVPLTETHSIPGPEEQTIANEQVALTLEKARLALSSFERKVLRLRMDGCTGAEIARYTGKPVKSVENALRRARQKLQ